jgi:hypothetical protein
MKALYWAWDGFDRCAINFLVIYDTAESVMKRKDLKGDGVYIGVRKLDWEGTSRRVFDAFAGAPNEVTEERETYLVDGIPVYIYSFDEDLCLRNPDIVLYEKENFNVPNPYSRFLELYGNSSN